MNMLTNEQAKENQKKYGWNELAEGKKKSCITLFLEQEQITKLIPKKTMKLTFRIRYRTVWGENLRIILNEEENNSIPLTTRDGVIWQNSYEYFTTDIEIVITFRYGVFRGETCVRKEFGAIPHSFY